METQYYSKNASSVNDNHSSKLAAPLHLQRLEKALRVDILLRQVESYVDDTDLLAGQDPLLVSGISKQQVRSMKTRAYSLGKVKKSKKWIKQILLEKSDSSDTDFNSDDIGLDSFGNYSLTEDDEETIEDMMKFANMRKHVKRHMIGVDDDLFSDVGIQSHPYKGYSTSVLASGVSKSIVPPPVVTKEVDNKSIEGPKPKKPRTSKSTKRKASSTTSSVSTATQSLTLGQLSVMPVTTTTISSTVTASSGPVVTLSSLLDEEPIPLPVTGLLQRSKSLDVTSGCSTSNFIPDSISITAISSPATLPSSSSFSLPSSSISLPEDPLKKLRLDNKLLDEIPYDMTLPDEILQSESSDKSSSCFTDEVASNQLPDDTEESNNSLLSQSLSSPPSVVLPNSVVTKAATAPSTPTGLSTVSGQLTQISVGVKSVGSNSISSQNRIKFIRKPISLPPTSTAPSLQISVSTPATPTSVSSSASSVMTREMMMAAKRKRHWTTISKKAVYRAYLNMVTAKTSVTEQRKLLIQTLIEERFDILKKWSVSLLKEIKKSEADGSALSKDIELRKEMICFWLGDKWMDNDLIEEKTGEKKEEIKDEKTCIIDMDDKQTMVPLVDSCLPASSSPKRSPVSILPSITIVKNETS